MKFEIRKAKPKDFIEVHKLIMDFAKFIQKPEKVKITPDQMVEDKDFFNCLIAISDEKIVGFATFFFSYYSWTGKTVYLDDLYVNPDFRGKGIGSNLFDRVMEFGVKEGCVKMKWQVSNWNSKAQEFYKSRGTNIDDVEINCDLDLK